MTCDLPSGIFAQHDFVLSDEANTIDYLVGQKTLKLAILKTNSNVEQIAHLLYTPTLHYPQDFLHVAGDQYPLPASAVLETSSLFFA